MNFEAQRKDLFNRLDPETLLELFEHLPDFIFYLKDAESRFMANNQISVLRKKGFIKQSEMLGKTDFDVSPASYAEKFVKDDKLVITTGNKIVNRLELVPNFQGGVEWSSTTKIPLKDKQGNIIGLAGLTRKVELEHPGQKESTDISPAIEYICQNYKSSLSVTRIAELSGMSVSQLERKFKRNLHVTPARFIIQVRLKAACRALSGTPRSISSIALENGFANAGTFSAQFKKEMGVTPKAYRHSYSTSGS